MIIGLTGIFSSGKSTVANILAKKGYKVINADRVGHKLLDKRQIRTKIVKQFGDVLTRNKVDRKKLKDIVFQDPKELKKLNRIVHPYLIKEVKAQAKKHKNAVIDAAILIELNLHKFVDKVIVVKTTKTNAIKRALKKKKYSKKEIDNILKSQLPQSRKLRYADIVIDNNKDLKHIKKQIGKYLNTK